MMKGASASSRKNSGTRPGRSFCELQTHSDDAAASVVSADVSKLDRVFFFFFWMVFPHQKRTTKWRTKDSKLSPCSGLHEASRCSSAVGAQSMSCTANVDDVRASRWPRVVVSWSACMQ